LKDKIKVIVAMGNKKKNAGNKIKIYYFGISAWLYSSSISPKDPIRIPFARPQYMQMFLVLHLEKLQNQSFALSELYLINH
jgi:hypothetical protein